MTTINKAILENLVGSQEDEFTNLLPDLNQNSELADAIMKIHEEEKAATVKAAAFEIQKLVKEANASIATSVANIRQMRRIEAAEQKLLKNINHAQVYGFATMNFLPLLSVLNNNTEHVVPADWKTPEAPKAKTEAPSAMGLIAAKQVVTKSRKINAKQ